MQNPNNVKVIFDKNNDALYFSRSQIPYPRNAGISKTYKHIGIYAYRRNFLLNYAKMESTPLEQTESLEQLRALENGYKIRVIISDCKFVGVDTEEDLKLVNEIYASMKL
jgi:3-deoxy-manno-octulosonate cytidylyltransferase (CMP-KDO synthetase)